MAAADKHVYMPQIATTLPAVDDDGQVVPKMCGAALVVYELPVRAIYPNSDTVFGNVYKTPSAITRLSLFLWFMEICRMTAVTCYIETVVDGKWHELTKKCDPVLIRLWIPFSDNTQLVQFLATVEKLVPPTPCDDDVVSDRQGRQSPANLKQEEEDVVNEPSPDFIKTPTDLARAVSLVFVGRACKTFKEIDTRGPTFDNETLGPNALTEVFSACGGKATASATSSRIITRTYPRKARFARTLRLSNRGGFEKFGRTLQYFTKLKHDRRPQRCCGCRCPTLTPPVRW
jgi:hypothetical protein